MKRYLSLILIILAITVSFCRAQPIETESGPIEFIGLKRWSAPDLWRRIYEHSPGEGVHACAAVLKDHFHFADASVVAYSDDSSGAALTWVVTVIEDTARVHYRPIPAASAPTLERWRDLGRLLLRRDPTVQAAIASYPKLIAGDTAGAEAKVDDFDKELRQFSRRRIDRDGIRRIWRLLEDQHSSTAMEPAILTLAGDGNDTNRVAAVAILMNFPKENRAICAAMDAWIDAEPAVASTAGAVLETFLSDSTRTVDWAPATGSLRLILGGTNLFALLPTMRLLTTTHISPSLAAPLLAGNGAMLLAYAAAHHDAERKAALALLKQLGGRDLGDDPAAWEKWVAGLVERGAAPGNDTDNRGH